MKFIKDKLPPHKQYPCTIKELKGYLKELPEKDLEGIKSIRLSNQLTSRDGALLHDGRIEIIFSVDIDCKKLLKGYLSKEFEREFNEFGGTVNYIDGERFVCWEQNNLKQYIKYVLFHEVGHNVFWKKHRLLGSGKREEKFATEYAKRYLNRK